MAFNYDHGDITIHVKNEQSTGRHALSVSSDAMRRASKVWATLLSGPFAEGRGETATLDYTEDATQAVLIVMDIIHLRFDRVPAILSLRGLRDLAVFTDKFDITHIVVPWLTGWLSWHSMKVNEKGSEVDWLWIAWEYGLLSVFNHVGKNLAFGSSHVAQSQAWGVFERDGMTDAAMLPPGTEDSILQARKDMTNTLLTLVYDYLDALLASPDRPQAMAGPFGDRSKCRNSRCDCIRLQLGSLILALKSIGLYPRKTADEVDMLPSQLRDELLKIRLSDCLNNELGRVNNDRFSSVWRKTCGDFDGVQQVIGKSISETASFATKEVLKHVERQNIKAKLAAGLVPGVAGNMILSLRTVLHKLG
ncbi:hypothetical protein BDP81DRAFT_187541 [Colletotrichum phormii]|uniref:Nuclear pore protein n=1 Tax=Colletotrichum phormii TaxID=359342 RepID=A0AAI9ZBY1_9PEZI|nr:uncharacterized protein BDP81DRAFT_187541 [Colletotrichum phormii]KAK1613523.1 hypothetical protein BDP81DRAFT_187541 [Colletotrichum phormii]